MILRDSLRLAACAALLAISLATAAQDMRLFRIGTGGAGGTYYPVGNLIAQAISQPPDAAPCLDLDRCGVPGLVAVAQSANGSVANVKAIGAGVLESGFAQSDVAYWAYSGSGVFSNAESFPDLRAIAGLYPETVHVVARKDAGISSIDDLRDKHVSLDEPGSGTLVDARLVLNAYGLSEEDIEPKYMKPTLAAEQLKAGGLDAFFIVAGHPVTSIEELARTTDIVIVPIDGPERAGLLETYRFFSSQDIETGTYEGIGTVPTVSVRALWVTRAGIDEALVYEITRALWNDASRVLLDDGHVKARAIRLKTALSGIGIPLHSGARRYYMEAGVIQ